MEKRHGVPYPVRLMNQLGSQDESDNGGSTSLFCSHSFDRIPHLNKKGKKFNLIISAPHKPS